MLKSYGMPLFSTEGSNNYSIIGVSEMFTFYENCERIELGNGVSRKILSHDKNLMAVEVEFEEGAIGAVHTHPHSQISYVIEGEFEATINGETKIIKQKDTYYTAPNVPHGVICLKKGILLDIFTPERDDFLK